MDQWRPITPAERYASIDVIRGLALFGVLIINLLTAFRVPLLEHILYPHPGSTTADSVVDFVVSALLEFKAFTIFAFLFGVGAAIQHERAVSRRVAATVFLARRFFWLFVLGTVHLFLIWNGDILALYGVCGLLLVPALRLRWRALAAIGLVLIALPEVLPLAVLSIPSGPAAAAEIAQAREVYARGSFAEILSFRWRETWMLTVPLLIAILPRTAGLMYCGTAAWRSEILRHPERRRRELLIALVCGAAVGAAATAAAHPAGPILLATAYVSGLVLWLDRGRSRRLGSVAALGRMALTNYLLQSIVLGFVFYGYGLGLFGRLGTALAAAIGLLLYAAQLQFSRAWLGHFRFGPFEWLWRSLAYWQFQPMLKR